MTIKNKLGRLILQLSLFIILVPLVQFSYCRGGGGDKDGEQKRSDSEQTTVHRPPQHDPTWFKSPPPADDPLYFPLGMNEEKMGHMSAIPADLIKALNNKGCSLILSC